MEIRTLKVMSKMDAPHKSFQLEVSLEHIDQVMQPSFWAVNVRVRPFRGNGREWEDRERGDDSH